MYDVPVSVTAVAVVVGVVVSILIVLLWVVSVFPRVSLLLYLMYDVPCVFIWIGAVYVVVGVQVLVVSVQYCVVPQSAPVPSLQVSVTFM